MSKRVFVIEYSKGTDKSFDGFRADTKPILNAVSEVANLPTEVVFYNPDKKDQLFDYLEQNALHVISRINPGNLKEVDEYFQFLKALSDKGVGVHTHPNVMKNFNFKDVLEKLKDTPLGEKTTKFYQKYDDFKAEFAEVVKKEKIRVLKTNYGSTGEGVYLVALQDDGSVVCTEAVNNEKEKFASLDVFIKEFEKNFEQEDENAVYFKGKKGFVSCKYLSRISEGEIRVLLVKEKPVSVVHKKPQEGEFSATLFSGAQYKYDTPDDPKWADVIKLTQDGIKTLEPYLEGFDYPLLWTMDYILDFDENGNDIYVLSEVNCSCVGITTELQYAKNVAEALK